MALFLSEDEVTKFLKPREALSLIEQVHLAHTEGRAIDYPRHRVRVQKSALHLMSGALLDEKVMGYKAYGSSRQGLQFFVYLHDMTSGKLLAIISADLLGRYRTGAAQAVATRYLSDKEEVQMALLGAGNQAFSQLLMLKEVKTLRSVRVWSRNFDRAKSFVETHRSFFEYSIGELMATESLEEVIDGVDVISTVTAASQPLLCYESLVRQAAPNVHINAIGSNALIRQEIDEKMVTHAGLICVDSRQVALSESGDLFSAIEKGRTYPEQWLELGQLIKEPSCTRMRGEGHHTLFESQGMAVQDLALANLVDQCARRETAGISLPF